MVFTKNLYSLCLPLVPFSLDLVPEHSGHIPLHVDDSGEAVLGHDLPKLGVLVTGNFQAGAEAILW